MKFLSCVSHVLLLVGLAMGLAWGDLVAVEDVLLAPGEILSQERIILKGSHNSVILADGAQLNSVIVKCDRPAAAPGAPGIIANGTVGARLRTVNINGCEGDALRAIGATDLQWHSGGWIGGQQDLAAWGIKLVNAHNIELFDLLGDKSANGLLIEDSTGVLFLASRIESTRPAGSPGADLLITAGSTGNIIGRSRFRYGNYVESQNPTNLWWDSTCENWIGYVGCVSLQNPPLTWGAPADYLPRIRTACLNASFQGGAGEGEFACDYQSPQAALAVSFAGDIVIVDTHPGNPDHWGDATIPAGVTLIGNHLAQKGTYGTKIKFVNVMVGPGARLINIDVMGQVIQE